MDDKEYMLTEADNNAASEKNGSDNFFKVFWNKLKKYIISFGWKRALAIFLLVIVFIGNVVFVVLAAITGGFTHVDGTVEVSLSDFDKWQNEIMQDVEGGEVESVPDGVIQSNEDVDIILLLGSDSRFGVGKAARSDTIMLAVIDKVHKKIKLISVLRDCYARLPDGYKSNKINSAFFFDSTNGNNDLKLMRETIKLNFGIEVNKFVVVDFSAFAHFVDSIGGLDIEVDELEADYMCHDKWYGDFPRYEAGPGLYHMDGAEALNYARIRRLKGQSDFQRTARQRNIVSLSIKAAKEKSYLELAAIVKELLPYVSTNLSEGELLGYAFDAPRLLGYEIDQMALPITGTWSYGEVVINGWLDSVISVNYNFNAKALSSFIFDDDLTYANGSKVDAQAYPAVLTAPTTTTTKTTTTTTATTTTTTTRKAETPATQPTSATAAPTETSATAETSTTTTAAPSAAPEPPADPGTDGE